MSHFSVAVLHKPDQDIETLLAPYDENLQVEPYISYTRQEAIDYAREHFPSCKDASDEECWANMAEDAKTDAEGNILSEYNPSSKWDWWSVGGRWKGMLKTANGMADIAFVRDVDFSIDENVRKSALRYWDVVVDGKPREPGEDFFSLYKPEYYREFYGDRETYARYRSQFSTYAVVTPDGVWHEKGRMGWWAMSSETPEEARDWEEHYQERFLDHQDEDLLITIVDCHI